MWVNSSFRSNQMSDVSESLILLTKNERPWAIRSGRSEEMSDCERIAQVAHQKWVNEWIAHFFERIAHSLIFGQKTSDSLGNQMSEFPALYFNRCSGIGSANVWENVSIYNSDWKCDLNFFLNITYFINVLRPTGNSLLLSCLNISFASSNDSMLVFFSCFSLKLTALIHFPFLSFFNRAFLVVNFLFSLMWESFER